MSLTSEKTITPIRSWAFWIARVAVFSMFAILPVHFIFHRWEVSEVITGFAFKLLLVVAVSSIVARKIWPIGWALLAMFLNSLIAFA